jgi:hypothetical protein
MGEREREREERERAEYVLKSALRTALTRGLIWIRHLQDAFGIRWLLWKRHFGMDAES